MKSFLTMASAALLTFLTLTVTSVSALSDTSWNLATSATLAVASANNISETHYPRCVNSNNWVTPNFRPSDCAGALRDLHNIRVLTEGFETFEFMYEGGTRQTQFPSFVLPEVFVYQTCTIQVLITRYYTGARIHWPHTYPQTEITTYFRIYNAAYAIYRHCVQKPPIADQPRYTGYSLLGAHEGILIIMWDTDSAANRHPSVPGDLAVNASSIASIASVAASSFLPSMDSIVTGSSMTTAASDISLVAPATGVPGLVNSEPMQFAPVEAS